jgi:DNA-binding LacI/PurR family transcriptional regulator
MADLVDLKYASLVSNPLTTIHQHYAAMGAIAIAKKIDRRIENDRY